MRDRNRQLGASTTAPTVAAPCTACRGFAHVPALRRGRWVRGACLACGGAGTLAAQEARGRHQHDCATDGDSGHVVSPLEPAPIFAVPAQEVAPVAEMLPLWECDDRGAWSRGDYPDSEVWVSAGSGLGCCGMLGVDGDDYGPWQPTIEQAMADADRMALEAGHALPWDSMVPDPELAKVLAGAEFIRYREGGTYYGGVEPASPNGEANHAAGLLFARTPWLDMPRADRLAATVRLLRAHGAIVTEAA